VTVVFAGGGTGGHLYPAIAIADALRERAAQIAFIGSADRLEASIVPKAGYSLRTIAGHSLPRRFSLQLFRAIALNLMGTIQSLRLLAAERPDLVVATGGYVCFPVALAARIRRLMRLSKSPVVLLEPNATLGLTNRLLTPMVDEIWGLESTGVPIRASLRRLPARDEAALRLGLDPSRKTLVAVGGSQGARSINDGLLDLVEKGTLPPGWQVFHLTGSDEYARVQTILKNRPVTAGPPHVVRAYLDDMADAYAVADLLLTRAGASTLGELAALGKPSILVPYPFAAEGHQDGNAARFEAAGAAVVLADCDLQAGKLPAVLLRCTEPARLEELTERARRLQGSDPIRAILARIDALAPRKSER
jgi:UDP-N-acetylglucosamine--N-acetylmuramyl-(pentapeptide) pyrophosphoryl-undecaprenol N-acetylglucosamine transferase